MEACIKVLQWGESDPRLKDRREAVPSPRAATELGSKTYLEREKKLGLDREIP